MSTGWIKSGGYILLDKTLDSWGLNCIEVILSHVGVEEARYFTNLYIILYLYIINLLGLLSLLEWPVLQVSLTIMYSLSPITEQWTVNIEQLLLGEVERLYHNNILKNISNFPKCDRHLNISNSYSISSNITSKFETKFCFFWYFVFPNLSFFLGPWLGPTFMKRFLSSFSGISRTFCFLPRLSSALGRLWLIEQLPQTLRRYLPANVLSAALRK